MGKFFYHILVLLSMCTFAYGEPGSTSKKMNADGPVRITSDEMVSEDNGNKIIFTGNVVTRRETMTIHSHTLELYSRDNKIVKIIAIGNVKVDRDGKYAEGDRAVYFEKERKIELLGNVKAWENDNVVTGEKGVFFIDDDKIKVFGDVHVVFYPKEEKKAQVKPEEKQEVTP